jgi:hypothetical protein
MTALTGRARTANLPYRPVDNRVDAALISWPGLVPDLPDDQTKPHRRGEQPFDKGELIL